MENKNQDAYWLAKKKVKKLKKFYHHLITYVLICVFLVAFNLYKNTNNLWSLWVVFGWGFALVLQAIKLFFPDIFFGKNWEEKKIQEYLQEDRFNN